MTITTSFLITLVLVVCGQAFDCSEKIIQEFTFDASFKTEVENLINRRLHTKELCNDLSTYLWNEVDNYCGLGMWKISDEATHKRIGGNIIQMLHYRTKAPASNAESNSDAQKRIEDLFKLNLFEENVFEEKTKSPTCAGTLQRALQLKQPFRTQLISYFDSFNRTACALFEKKIKFIFSQTIGFSEVEWLQFPDQSKRDVVEALFRLLYLSSGAKLPLTATKADHIVAELVHHELLRGNIFEVSSASMTISTESNLSTGVTKISDKSDDATWQAVLWMTLTVTLLIALYLGLRYLNVIPSFT